MAYIFHHYKVAFFRFPTGTEKFNVVFTMGFGIILIGKFFKPLRTLILNVRYALRITDY